MKPLVLFITVTMSLACAAKTFEGPLLPWSGRFLDVGPEDWKSRDLSTIDQASSSRLFKNAAELKLEKNLRCQSHSVVFDTVIPSLSNKKVTIRYMQNLTTKRMNLDAFVKGSKEYKELLRSSYQVRNQDDNNGQIGKVSVIDLATQVTTTRGMMSSDFISHVMTALGGDKTNTAIDGDWLKVLEDSDVGFACCFNQKCRAHIEGIKPNSTLNPNQVPMQPHSRIESSADKGEE